MSKLASIRALVERILKTVPMMCGRSVTAKLHVSDLHYPNSETQKAIRDTENGVGVTVCDNVEELFEQLGL